MRRHVTTGVAVSAFLLASLAWAAPTASAGPPNQTTLTLACDRGMSASATVALRTATNADAGSSSLTCSDSTGGTRRVRVVLVTPVTAATADITSFAGSFAGSCTGTVTLPTRLTCPSDGSPGAVLSVR